MKNITIKELYAGKPDAKDEINYDGLDDFIKTFVIPTNFNLSDLISGSKCFITGYKGTGKTALLFFLDNYLKKLDNSMCSSFIFFKEEFTDAKKSELEILSRRILSSISILDNTLVTSTDFEYIWRWIFFKRIISDNEEYSNNLFQYNKEWDNFQKIVSRIKAPSDTKKMIIPPNLKIAVPYKNQGCEICPEIDVDFQKSKSDYAYQQFIKIVDDAERAFVKLTRTDIPYYIFVDELEAYYGDESIFRRDLYLIRDLIFTVKRFNGLFLRIDKKRLKIICSVRSEIIKAITRNIVTKELNKVISGFEVPLIWDYNNTTSYAHPIIQILLKRIGTCENDTEDLNYKTIYQRWFPEKIHDIEPANYILNNSWCKPRDIVRLLLSAQNSINNNSSVFNQAVFSSLQKRYSSDSLAEIVEEMRALYTAEQIDEIISCFTGFRTIFSVKQLKDRVNSLYSETILSTKFVQVIGDLYRLGFLGNYFPLSKTYRWQHKGDNNVILEDQYRLMIHHALQSALSIGSKQDYGLKRNDSPQIGDIVEASVCSVSRDFVFVEFEKNEKIYKGVIHISEVAEHYIRLLSNEVIDGDQFKAEIISYDERHSDWRLSKKRVEFYEQKDL